MSQSAKTSFGNNSSQDWNLRLL